MQSKAKVLLGAAAAAIGVWLAHGAWRSHVESSSKLLLNRIWLDRLPTKETEPAEVFVALEQEPIGLFQRASRWEGGWAMFKYELRGDDEIELAFPQDGSKHKARYKARACNEKGFDYCLEIEGAPRGAKKYVSKKEWEIEQDMAGDLPGALDAGRREESDGG